MGYYFISIGGSGARVLEALTHFCMAGLMPNEERKGHFYAMAIDPDISNGNLTRTKELLDCSKHFQTLDVGKGTPLLKTTVKCAGPNDIFCWSPAPPGKDLNYVIGEATFRGSSVDKLYRSLYTKKERETPLDEGFRGHPSIGAAVMAKNANDVTNTKAWRNLINEVHSDVTTHGSAQIFLAGSIFGGTGAAGLPTIVRLLRNTFAPNVANGTVRIGGVLLLPYFSFSPTQEVIDEGKLFAYSDNFLTNTKAALRYYANTSGSGYDSIYFIGDESMTPTRTFSVGSSSQLNDAHIVDFFAAMAALHFYHERNFGVNSKIYYIAHQDNNKFQWNDLPAIRMDDNTTVSMQKLFVQFTRFIFAYLHIVKPVFSKLESGDIRKNNVAWYVDNLQKCELKSNSPIVEAFEKYAAFFARWLNQFERSAGIRSVELIKRDFFNIQENGSEITIDPKLFSSLDYGTSNVTIDSVTRSLTGGGGGFFGKLKSIFGGNGNNNRDLGTDFGRFLRRLYDGCAAN